MDAVRFECRWSGEVTPKFLADFISVLEQVWGKGFDRDLVYLRYINNIYGPSLMILTYAGGSPCGTQAFWRNDLGERIAYQADDGAVIETARGRGLLREMLKRGVDILGEDVLLYSYTNHKSKPSFLKMGWDVMQSRPLRPFIFTERFLSQCPYTVDYAYADWFLSKKDHIAYVKRNGCYYLVLHTSHRCIDYVISACDEQTALLFRKQKKPLILVYSEQVNTIDAEKIGSIVVLRHRGEYIPVWKCDAI